MQTIQNLFRIGYGPSSSHTMAPRRAAEDFLSKYPQAVAYRVTLYGSLAATGRGHMTDRAIIDAFKENPVEIIWQPETVLPFHPNGMDFFALDKNNQVIGEWCVFSTGGGALSEGFSEEKQAGLYPLTTMQEILKYCTKNGKTHWEYVEECEGEGVWHFLEKVDATMQSAIQRGLSNEGRLPGDLGLPRRAWAYHRRLKISHGELAEGFLAAYALAVAEENASGHEIVTAPTCGSAGVLPAVLQHLRDLHETSDIHILRALATAGLVGNLIKTNASISGAEVGCQGEIGAACAMSAAAAAQLMGGSIRQIEYAAEMGLEHHLGLTCDPVNGLVQIPCIERNVFAATRAIDCATFAILSDGSHRVSFDEVVRVMNQTGHDLPSLYRETSIGGLAVNYRFPSKEEKAK